MLKRSPFARLVYHIAIYLWLEGHTRCRSDCHQVTSDRAYHSYAIRVFVTLPQVTGEIEENIQGPEFWLKWPGPDKVPSVHEAYARRHPASKPNPAGQLLQAATPHLYS